MSTIHVINSGEKVDADLVTSILVCLQRSGVPMPSACGGRARCGQCAVRVLKGMEFLTRKGEAEMTRLETIGADDDVRLACQTYTRGDIEIEILNPQG